jgi:hypothetical protein
MFVFRLPNIFVTSARENSFKVAVDHRLKLLKSQQHLDPVDLLAPAAGIAAPNHINRTLLYSGLPAPKCLNNIVKMRLTARFT